MFAFAIIGIAPLFSFVGAADLPNSHVVGGVCNSTYACGVADANWPTTSYTCANSVVSAYSLSVVTENGILLGYGHPVEASTTSCSDTSLTDVTYMKYNQGRYAVFYTMKTTCNCASGTLANCTAATGLTDAACNIATFSFCGVQVGSSACTASSQA